MHKLAKLLIALFLVLDIILFFRFLLQNLNIQVLNPKGVMAIQEKDALFFAAGICLAIVIPIVLTTFFFAWKYRDGNKKAKYTPDWNNSAKFEVFRWGLMCAVIGILAVFTWRIAHVLDPWKVLDSKVEPITIQVVALQWRWLFIYPKQQIATMNFVEFPESTPINFELTADAPMNSFWIPQLGGQMYAMAGMSTKTHFMVNKIGEFNGASAEISGSGFSGMKFVAKSVSNEDFKSWVENTKNATNRLDFAKFNEISKPLADDTVVYYTVDDNDLYNKVVMKYMSPTTMPLMHPDVTDKKMQIMHK